ncbi:hypothetical protein ACFQZT_05330 [Paenibacillus sp. GCM10027628]|uniref:hypothetical protein n=1 Tax=Paenibacillus sp. GCM10027628 TaxID=3273413 RepID=UPI003630329C
MADRWGANRVLLVCILLQIIDFFTLSIMATSAVGARFPSFQRWKSSSEFLEGLAAMQFLFLH